MAEGLAEKGTTFNCRECKYGSECNTANAHGYKVGFCSQYTQKIKAQTNADRIRCMTDEEITELLYDCFDLWQKWCHESVPVNEDKECSIYDCRICIKKWLKEEVKDV